MPRFGDLLGDGEPEPRPAPPHDTPPSPDLAPTDEPPEASGDASGPGGAGDHAPRGPEVFARLSQERDAAAEPPEGSSTDVAERLAGLAQVDDDLLPRRSGRGRRGRRGRDQSGS